jgi:hypothetical protein
MNPAARAPRGVRNNNPGNLRDGGIRWRGLVGRDAQGFCVFADLRAGLRALALDLLDDYRRDGRRTLDALIAEFAPPGENDTAAYVRHLAAALGRAPEAALELERPGELGRLVAAICRHENGRRPDGGDWCSAEDIAAAVAAALTKGERRWTR